MRISIENFYVIGSANINNLWYEDGSFSVQRGNGSPFRISKDNIDKNLRGISPKQIEKINKIGYFTIHESFSGFNQAPSSGSESSSSNSSSTDTSKTG